MINEYQLDNKSPYTVWIQYCFKTSNNSNQTKRVSKKFNMQKIHQHNVHLQQTKSRVKVGFKNSLEANQCWRIIIWEGGKVFVPSFRLVRRGLIRGIISEEEKTTEAEYKVLDIRRFNKRNRDPNIHENDPKWVPSRLVIIFSDQSLPNKIEIHKIEVKVEPYMTLSIMYTLCVYIYIYVIFQLF